jgi:hypothetical protein
MQGNLIGAALSSVGTLGQAAGMSVGVDYGGQLCSYATNNPTDLAVSTGIINEMTGGACTAGDGSALTNTIAPGSQNLDAAAMPAGFPTYPIAWGIGSGAGYVTCGAFVSYGCYSYSPLPQAITGSQSLVLTNSSNLSQGGTTPIYWCQNTTTKAITGNQLPGISFGSAQHSNTLTVNCAGGTVLYALTIGTTVATTQNPDTYTHGTTAATIGQADRTWYSGLSPLGAQYPGASADPTRWLTCTIKGSDGQTYTAQSMNFKESQGFPQAVCPSLPSGVTAGELHVYLNGGPAVIDLTGAVMPTTAYQNAATAYPACANGSCELHVYDKTGDCNAGDSTRCAAWFTDPTKSNDYTCHYGTYTAPLAECNSLANFYDPTKVSQGNPYADPATGTDTGTQTAPLPGAGAGPSGDPVTGDDNTNCWASGWSWNPLDWVLTPIKCAFSPRASAVTKMETDVQNEWGASGFGKVAAAVNLWAGQMPTMSGCQGPQVAFHIDFWQHMGIPVLSSWPAVDYSGYPLSACTDPAATLATLAKVISDAVVVWLCGLLVVRQVSSIIGARGLN